MTRLLADDFGSGQVFLSMLWFFLFFIWIWLLITVFADIFRSPDLSGWGKALWSLFVIFLPYLGVFVYLIAEHQGMTDRNLAQAQAAQTQFDDYVKNVAATQGPAGEIEKAKALLDSGAISQAEFDSLKAKALA
jgi:Short C-terminal domain/Phospholipase_D-nuclease N-terminal